MTFPNKGENHEAGVKNEKEIVKHQNEHPENAITKQLEKEFSSLLKLWKHEGGTKQKKDASVLFESGQSIGISIKNHKSGTFDWVNTTKGVPEDLKVAVRLFAKNNSLKSEPITPITKTTRDKLANMFSDYLDKLSSNDIANLLNMIYQTEADTKHIIVNDQKSRNLILFPETNLDQYCNIKHNHTYILKATARAKTSRQIWIRSADGSEKNTNLRIRANLNNGITALLGTSSSNKSASPCLKIQQDNVDKFISECSGKVFMPY
tara:strand:- start:2050 stop:2841 length:792 start_codon:yes stop_codon:yes gene_type:complete